MLSRRTQHLSSPAPPCWIPLRFEDNQLSFEFERLLKTAVLDRHHGLCALRSRGNIARPTVAHYLYHTCPRGRQFFGPPRCRGMRLVILAQTSRRALPALTARFLTFRQTHIAHLIRPSVVLRRIELDMLPFNSGAGSLGASRHSYQIPRCDIYRYAHFGPCGRQSATRLRPATGAQRCHASSSAQLRKEEVVGHDRPAGGASTEQTSSSGSQAPSTGGKRLTRKGKTRTCDFTTLAACVSDLRQSWVPAKVDQVSKLPCHVGRSGNGGFSC